MINHAHTAMTKHGFHQNSRAARDFDAIERALDAVVRWLVNRGGAKNPVLEHYFTADRLPLPSDQITTALKRARELAERAESMSE